MQVDFSPHEASLWQFTLFLELKALEPQPHAWRFSSPSISAAIYPCSHWSAESLAQ